MRRQGKVDAVLELLYDPGFVRLIVAIGDPLEQQDRRWKASEQVAELLKQDRGSRNREYIFIDHAHPDAPQSRATAVFEVFASALEPQDVFITVDSRRQKFAGCIPRDLPLRQFAAWIVAALERTYVETYAADTWKDAGHAVVKDERRQIKQAKLQPTVSYETLSRETMIRRQAPVQDLAENASTISAIEKIMAPHELAVLKLHVAFAWSLAYVARRAGMSDSWARKTMQRAFARVTESAKSSPYLIGNDPRPYTAAEVVPLFLDTSRTEGAIRATDTATEPSDAQGGVTT